MTVLYHKKLPGMSLDEGYIGIADDFDIRQEQHEIAAHITNSPYKVHEMMRYNKNKYITIILCKGNREYITDLEYKLRPHWNKGWNMAPGGGNLGGWRDINRYLDEYIYQPSTGKSIRVLTYNSPSALAKDIFGKSGYRRQLHSLLIGQISEFPKENSWQIQNKQTYMKVKNKLDNIKYWSESYLRKNNIVYKVYRNGHTKLVKDSKDPSFRVAKLLRGQQNNAGFSLISEEEYNQAPKENRKVYGSKHKDKPKASVD